MQYKCKKSALEPFLNTSIFGADNPGPRYHRLTPVSGPSPKSMPFNLTRTKPARSAVIQTARWATPPGNPGPAHTWARPATTGEISDYDQRRPGNAGRRPRLPPVRVRRARVAACARGFPVKRRPLTHPQESLTASNVRQRGRAPGYLGTKPTAQRAPLPLHSEQPSTLRSQAGPSPRVGQLRVDPRRYTPIITFMAVASLHLTLDDLLRPPHLAPRRWLIWRGHYLCTLRSPRRAHPCFSV